MGYKPYNRYCRDTSYYDTMMRKFKANSSPKTNPEPELGELGEKIQEEVRKQREREEFFLEATEIIVTSSTQHPKR